MELTQQHTYTLKASEAATAQRDDDNLSYVWFTDRSAEPPRYFSLTKSHDDGSFYSERDDQKWGVYGGVREASFDEDKLIVHFDKASADGLGGIETVVVDCSHLSESARAQVSTTLAYIFSGSKIALTIA